MPVVYIQTHTGCTHSCKYCPHPVARAGMPQESLSLEALGKILDNAEGVPEFVIGLQSEPLQDSLLFEKLELIKSQRPESKLVVETSALDLTIGFAVKLRDSGVDRIRIGLWETPIPARVRHLHFLGLEVELIIAVNALRSWNHDRLRQMYGEKCIITEIPVNNGRGFVRSFSTLNSRELNEFRSPCDRLYKELCIAANGKVVGCQEDYTREKIIGDATEQTIKEIWNSEELRKFRGLHEGNETELDSVLKGTICEHCNYTR